MFPDDQLRHRFDSPDLNAMEIQPLTDERELPKTAKREYKRIVKFFILISFVISCVVFWFFPLSLFDTNHVAALPLLDFSDIHPDLLDRYAEFLETDMRGRSLRRLIDAWLDAYRPDLQGSAQVATLIRRRIAHGGTATAQEWAPAEAALGLFDHDQGPQRVGEAMAASATEANRVLALARIDDDRRRAGGFCRAVFESFLARIEADLRYRMMEVERLRGLLRLIDQSPTWRIAPASAHALLRPWMSGPPATPAMRGLIYEHLMTAFGDPRRPGNTRWQGVNRDAEDVFKRWLAGATLKEFFELISDRADERQWRYRNAFWTAVLDSNLVEDAWVLLGRDVQSETCSHFGTDIACGRLIGYTAGQSVILMRLGNLIVAEVSHSGSLRIWRDGDRGAPTMGLAQVRREQVTAPCLPFETSNDPDGLRHTGAADGIWQDRAARLIRAQTGVTLNKSRYMPSP